MIFENACIDARTRQSIITFHYRMDLKEMELPSTKPPVTESTVNLTEDVPESRPTQNHREKLNEVLHSQKTQYVIVGMVVIDIIIVIAELVLDLRAASDHHANSAAHVLHYISIAILSIFLIELVLKIYAMGLSFFKHKMEVFDGIVIIVSFALDVAFSSDGAVGCVSLIVIFRLWRVTRIVNGIILSVQMQAEKKIKALETENASLKEEVEQLKTNYAKLESEQTTLKQS